MEAGRQIGLRFERAGEKVIALQIFGQCWRIMALDLTALMWKLGQMIKKIIQQIRKSFWKLKLRIYRRKPTLKQTLLAQVIDPA
jgi:hypothetical protein